MEVKNVLSLFDGISVCKVALERAGFNIENYYSSEIDKYAIQISNKNHPNNIQLGSVLDYMNWDIDWSSIDLVTGGFPCQSWSVAGKQMGDKDDRGMLFWVMLDIIKKVLTSNPNAKFLMENVKMKKEFEEYITFHTEQSLGKVNKHLINSSLVSAQNRQRYYWTNIDGITQPTDKNILLNEIILKETESKYLLTEEAIDYMSRLRNGKPRWEYHKNPIDGKAACLTANMYKGVPYGVLIIPEATKKGYVELSPNNGIDLTFITSKTRRGRLMDDKSNCLTAANHDYCWYDGYIIRKLTPVECERLQTIPDNYTEGVSNTQRYKMLGNSWTADVIVHIFKHIK
jgi:DNA-cytosine methyltransferase